MRNLSNTLRLLTAISTTLAIGMMAAPAAQASSYYNCNTPNGCTKVDSTNSRSDYDVTKYPIVMAHGFLGWNRMFGVYDYFNGIPQVLTLSGADVYTTKVSTVNSIELRGEQLAKQIKMVKAISGSDKVNLIGHSQGGFDSRYASGVLPGSVASITTASTPHIGLSAGEEIKARLAKKNAFYGTPEGEDNPEAKLLYGFFNSLGFAIDVASGTPIDQSTNQSADSFLTSTSKEAFVAFNKKFPAPIPATYCGKTPDNNVVNNVAYYSFSGVGQLTNALDPSDLVMAYSKSLYDDAELNDGLVASCATRVGKVIRDDYHMNHLDSINQLLGLVSWRETNPLVVYRAQVNRLKNQGF